MTALADELLRLEMPWPAARALLELGVPRAVVAAAMCNGDLAVADVDLSRDGSRFAFGGPTRRLILGVRAGGALTDLVALSSTCEDEWALYRGAADFLGEDLVGRATVGAWRELRLFGTPMAWLRGGGCYGGADATGGAGVCVLDWTAGALGALRGLGGGVTLVCDRGARAKLEALLAHGGLPVVAEERPMIGRAA